MRDLATRHWWARVAQIRNDLPVKSFNWAQAQAMEQAVAELNSEACSPWFDERGFKCHSTS